MPDLSQADGGADRAEARASIATRPATASRVTSNMRASMPSCGRSTWSASTTAPTPALRSTVCTRRLPPTALRVTRRRSFLTVSPSCASCHTDAHKGSLGANCATCHTTTITFAESRTRVRSQPDGVPAGRRTCHGDVRVVSHDQDVIQGRQLRQLRDLPHRSASRALWQQLLVVPHAAGMEDHADRSLAHGVSAARCARVGAVRVVSREAGHAGEAACRHVCGLSHGSASRRVQTGLRQLSYRDDIQEERHWRESQRIRPFVHTVPAGRCSCRARLLVVPHRPGRPIDNGKAAAPAAPSRGTSSRGSIARPATGGTTRQVAATGGNTRPVADFRGLKTECVSCHTDVHRAELGTSCETCHNARTFQVIAFKHAKQRPFFDGQHASLRCAQCHASAYGTTAAAARTVPAVATRPARTAPAAPAVRAGFTTTAETCVSCHTDVHLGQVGARCETCHTVDTAKFAVINFQHARTKFPLTGKHAPLKCEACHAVATQGFPSGHGAARRLTGIGTECASCHKIHTPRSSGPIVRAATRPTRSRSNATHIVERRYCDRSSPASTSPRARRVISRRPAGVPRLRPFWRVTRHRRRASLVIPTCTGVHSVHVASRATSHDGPGDRTCLARTRRSRRSDAVLRAARRGAVRNAEPCLPQRHDFPARRPPSRRAVRLVPSAAGHLQGHADQVLRLSLGSSPGRSLPPAARLAVRAVPPHDVLDRRAMGPCRDDGRDAGRRPSSGHLSGVPHQQHVPRRADQLRLVPPAGLPERAHAEPCRRRFPDDVRSVPPGLGRDVQSGAVRSQRQLPAGRRSLAADVRDVSQGQRLRWHVTRLCRMPSPALRPHDQSESRRRQLPDDLRELSPADRHQLAWSELQSCGGVSAGWRPRAADLRELPQEQHLHRHFARLRRLPSPADYDRTTTPNHAAAGFPTTCENCHRPTDTSWAGAGFNHATVFALVGRHAQTVCANCHVNNVYRGTPRDCVGCHRAQYERTTMPSHVAAGFPTTCESCHRPTDASFQGAGFNHASVFALVGRHAQTACTSCHANNVYRGTPRDCIGCHRTQYDRTTTPNHAAAGFPTSCENCHRADSASWTGAGFNHSSVFALVGRHAQTACASCHVNNVYRGTPRDCVGCHRPLYDRTTAPNHAAAGFPMTCDSCHRATDTTWNQGHVQPSLPDFLRTASDSVRDVSPGQQLPGVHLSCLSRARSHTDGRQAQGAARLSLRLAGLLQLPPERTALSER